MKFDDLDAKMRRYETVRDQSALPGVHMVARIDGRGFTRLTKEVMDYKRPFDETFRDHMIATVEHLMNCGFRALYGYTQSDEISVLFEQDDDSFGRSVRKWTSILAGEASAAFSARLGRAAAFDCRVIELPGTREVVDYFRWRAEDAHRNALNAWCYWKQRDDGASVNDATRKLEGMSIAAKNELLFSRGINYNDLPAWQKRGIGVVWEDYQKEGVNPITGEQSASVRRRLRVLEQLPMGEEYSVFLRSLVSGEERR